MVMFGLIVPNLKRVLSVVTCFLPQSHTCLEIEMASASSTLNTLEVKPSPRSLASQHLQAKIYLTPLVGTATDSSSTSQQLSGVAPSWPSFREAEKQSLRATWVYFSAGPCVYVNVTETLKAWLPLIPPSPRPFWSPPRLNRGTWSSPESRPQSPAPRLAGPATTFLSGCDWPLWWSQKPCWWCSRRAPNRCRWWRDTVWLHRKGTTLSHRSKTQCKDCLCLTIFLCFLTRELNFFFLLLLFVLFVHVTVDTLCRQGRVLFTIQALSDSLITLNAHNTQRFIMIFSVIAGLYSIVMLSNCIWGFRSSGQMCCVSTLT